MGKVTVAIKRCKGCVFWDFYNGKTANDVMRKLYEAAPPGRKRRACQLVLRAEQNADGTFSEDEAGNPVKVPLKNALRWATKADTTGEYFGVRTSPNFVCQYHTPRHPPYVKPSPLLGVVEHIVNPIDIGATEGLIYQSEGDLKTIVLQP
jgi:hypothetical protein